MPISSLVLAIGDSLVAGYGLPPADGFPAQLQARLRSTDAGARVIGAGVAGDTTADVRRRLPAVLARMDARPDLAIVQVGPNDVLRQVPPVQTRANLDAIVVELGRCGVPVLLTTVAPPVFLRERTRGYERLHAEVAAAHGAATCAFFPANVLGHPEMVLADRVHPKARAIAAVVAAMLPTVTGLLARGEGVRRTPELAG